MHLTTDQRKDLRRIAHHLKPVVTVAERGLTPSVSAEIERALVDHELIKIRITTNDRSAREATAVEICAAGGAALVAQIGKIAVIFRPNPAARPHLSNLQRPAPVKRPTTPDPSGTARPKHKKPAATRPSAPGQPAARRKAAPGRPATRPSAPGQPVARRKAAPGQPAARRKAAPGPGRSTGRPRSR